MNHDNSTSQPAKLIVTLAMPINIIDNAEDGGHKKQRGK